MPADRFVFDGFLPVKPGRRVHRLEALRALETTVVCYESPHRILASLEAIGQVFGDTEIVVAREMTKQFEEIVRGTAAGLRERFASGPVRGEFTVVIPAAPDRSGVTVRGGSRPPARSRCCRPFEPWVGRASHRPARLSVSSAGRRPTSSTRFSDSPHDGQISMAGAPFPPGSPDRGGKVNLAVMRSVAENS